MMLVKTVAADEPEVYLAHDTIKQGDDSYLISGEDPYFVTQLQDNQTSASANILSLDISIQKPSGHNEALAAELFFKVIRMESVPIFDPSYKLQFPLPDTDFSRITIPLPTEIKLHAGQLMRLDIDACQKCLVTITKKFWVGRQQAELGTAKIDIGNFLNGIQNIPAQGKYISEFTQYQDWRLHDFEHIQNGLLISDTDPFLVSPPLHVNTENLSGILVDVQVPSFNPPIYDFQLFYSTEKHRFVEKASSVIRVLGKSADVGGHNQLRFFVPLDFLSEQFPPVDVLKRVRLDLVRYPDDRNHSDTWSLPKIKLVHKSESIDLRKLSTTRIVHAKRQHAAFEVVVAEIFKKLGDDLAFIISYSIIIILIIIIAVRRFKASAG
jgi:hypothetical protein